MERDKALDKGKLGRIDIYFVDVFGMVVRISQE